MQTGQGVDANPDHSYFVGDAGSDTTAPAPPVITTTTALTSDSTPAIEGTAEAGSTVNLYNDTQSATYVVTVESKTSEHTYDGTGSSLGYKIDGVFSPFLTFTPGNTYRFDQSDSSNVNHPLRFYLEAQRSNIYSTGVTTNGTPGQTGAYTEITVSDTTPSELHFQCAFHG